MGRSPCCEKVGLKKGPWTPEEDQKLLAYIEEHGHGSWRALPEKAGLQRCGKSCRLRWTNYLRPDIKRGKFSLQEEQTIIQLHALLGNRWSAIATHLPKRTDNEIKNYWNTHLKKRLTKMGIDPVTHKPMNDTLLSSDCQAKNAANLSHMAQWESARLEAEARLVRQSKLLSAGSTSSQTQNSEMAPSSSQLQKPIEPIPCLDVLKVWSNGVWGKMAAVNGGTMVVGEVESPTSTLTSAARATEGCGATKEKSDNWKNLPEFKSGVSNPVSFQAFHESSSTVWAPESVRSSSSENGAPCPNFMEKFTDLLLSASPGERCVGDDCLESEDVSGGGGHYFEDNKNYWNSILNLVNSSPSDSPIF